MQDDAPATASSPAPGTAVASAVPEASPPVTMAEYRATAALLGTFVLTMLMALLFSQPFQAAGIQAFEDPDAASNTAWYLLLILAFTALILYLRRKEWLIQVIILAAVGLTIFYVTFPVLSQTLGWPGLASLLVAVGVAGGATFWLWVHPEWYVVDIVGVLVAAGGAAIFGISLSVVPVVLLLVALAVYDAIAVYKTKHMLSLADAVIKLRLPVLLVIPKSWPYSFLDETSRFRKATAKNKGEREAMFMGLGDLVMPTILVVSAHHFALAGWGVLPALGAAVGTLVGFGVLMGFVLRGNPQAGLPLLNGGALVGFLAGVQTATGSLVFW